MLNFKIVYRMSASESEVTIAMTYRALTDSNTYHQSPDQQYLFKKITEKLHIRFSIYFSPLA